MSRIGKMPIPIPSGVDVKVGGEEIQVKGPKGLLTVKIQPGIQVAIEDGNVVLTRSSEEQKVRAFHGLNRALLANATTGVLYEGSPDTPSWERWWEIVEEYGVTVLYTAPTAIRAFMKQGEALPAKHDLSTLRLLGSVGDWSAAVRPTMKRISRRLESITCIA